MKFNKKLAPLPLFVSLALTGCLEVDDASNDGIVDALNQQNQALAEQNDLLAEQLENQQRAVTLTGVVVDAETQLPIGEAEVAIYRGETVLAESTTNESGAFTVDSLPSSSDLTVVVSSSDEAYFERAFFISTMPVTNGEGYDDIGLLQVSKPVDVKFSVVSAQSGEAISGLVFRGFSYSGNASSTVNNYVHTSVYDEESQEYSITLPKGLNVTLQADIDQDDDGEADFDYSMTDNVGISEDQMFIYDASAFETSQIVLNQNEGNVEEEKSISISLIDEQGIAVEEATFLFTYQNNTYTAKFDESSQLYQFTIPFDGNVTIEMPSFSVEGTTYSSGSLSLYRQTNHQTSDTLIRVSTSGYTSNSYYNLSDEEDLTVVLALREVLPQSNVALITSHLSPEDFAYSVYYSEAVELEESEVLLTYEDIQVVKGNESTDDGVPAGYTYVLSVEEEVAVSVAPSLGGIKHTLTPSTALSGNTSYRYTIGSVTPLSGGITGEVNDDDYSFTTPVDDSATFTINDLKLDNANYHSNGTVIVNQNSAGVPNTASNYSDSVGVILPSSVESLEYLVLNFLSYNRNGNAFSFVNQYTLVRNGFITMDNVLAIDVAQNENVINQAYTYVLKGSTAPDGTLVYRERTSLYLEDNTPSSPVTATFNYEYQTKDGDHQSGTLTLPIL